ncbi:MAG: PAS domain S-box protein [Synechococcales bacterium]|nr:PAS domain S-box protein [Synechococcales bacterium]
MTSMPQDSRFTQLSVDDVLASLQEVVWSANSLTLNLIYISSAATQVYGCSPAELLSEPQHWLSLIHPQDQAEVRQRLMALVPDHPIELTYRLQSYDGGGGSRGDTSQGEGDRPTYRWMSSRAILRTNIELGVRIDGVTRPQVDCSNESPTRWACCVSEPTFPSTDLVCQQGHEVDCQKCSLFENAVEGIFQSTPDGRYRCANAALANIYGFASAVEFVAQITDIAQQLYVNPGDRTRFLNALHQHDRVSRFEAQFYRKDGRIIWVSKNAWVVRDRQGNVLYYEGTVEDITLQKQAEAARREAENALRQSQAMLQLVINNIPERIFWKDTHLRYLGCNNQQAKASGLASPEEIVGKTDYDLPWTPEQAESYRAADRHVLETGQPVYQIPESQRQADGTVVWLEANKMPLYNADGQLLGLLGTAEDVTHRRLAEEALRQQVQEHHALRRVIQAIRDSLDLDTIFVTAVSQITELLGADRVEIIQYLAERSVWRIVTDYYCSASCQDLSGCEIDDRNNEVAARLKQLEIIRCHGLPDAPGNEAYQTLLRVCPGSWLVVPLQVNGQASGDLKASVWGCLCLIREPANPWQEADVTRVTVVANQLAIAIQQSQLYQRVRQFNTELEQQVARRTGDLRQMLNFEALLKRITDKVRDSLDETYILQTVVRELAESLVLDCCSTGLYDLATQTVTVQHEHRTIDIPSLQGTTALLSSRPGVYDQLLEGHCFQFSMRTANPKRPNYQPTVLCCPVCTSHGILGDLWLYRPHFITFSCLETRLVRQVANQCAIAIRQARLYQAAQKQVEELERLNRLKDDFLSTVSHELRTPLANIKMATELLEVVLRQSPATDPRFRQYLVILQNETQQEMALINDLLDLQHLNAGTQAIEIVSVNLHDWLPHIAEAFELRTQQNQQTLTVTIPASLPPIQTDLTGLKRIVMELLNNACKYSPPEAEISVTAHLQEDSLHLRICNTGVEIPQSELTRIFDKFYRIPQSDRWRHGGTGLGLALAQQIAVYLGGRILATSHSNTTCFTVVLPLQAPHYPRLDPMLSVPPARSAESD